MAISETTPRGVNGKSAGSCHASGRPTILSSTEEDELYEVLKMMSRRGFLLSDGQVRDMAKDYAVKNNLTAFAHNKENRARYYWLHGFLK